MHSGPDANVPTTAELGPVIVVRLVIVIRNILLSPSLTFFPDVDIYLIVVLSSGGVLSPIVVIRPSTFIWHIALDPNIALRRTTSTPYHN